MIDILFMGTPDFAKASLEKLYSAGYNILRCCNKLRQTKEQRNENI